VAHQFTDGPVEHEGAEQGAQQDHEGSFAPQDESHDTEKPAGDGCYRRGENQDGVDRIREERWALLVSVNSAVWISVSFSYPTGGDGL